METVSFLSDTFKLFLHLPKKKGASGSRDGWYPGLITTNHLICYNFLRISRIPEATSHYPVSQ